MMPLRAPPRRYAASLLLMPADDTPLMLIDADYAFAASSDAAYSFCSQA